MRPKLTYKVYRYNRLGAHTPIHRSPNNSQPISHWLLLNVTIHNPHPTWFPHDHRNAVLENTKRVARTDPGTVAMRM